MAKVSVIATDEREPRAPASAGLLNKLPELLQPFFLRSPLSQSLAFGHDAHGLINLDLKLSQTLFLAATRPGANAQNEGQNGENNNPKWNRYHELHRPNPQPQTGETIRFPLKSNSAAPVSDFILSICAAFLGTLFIVGVLI